MQPWLVYTHRFQIGTFPGRTIICKGQDYMSQFSFYYWHGELHTQTVVANIQPWPKSIDGAQIKQLECFGQNKQTKLVLHIQNCSTTTVVVTVISLQREDQKQSGVLHFSSFITVQNYLHWVLKSPDNVIHHCSSIKSKIAVRKIVKRKKMKIGFFTIITKARID